ncbi:thiamine phosphate synthase [Fusibacter sp. JL216-2]|uniref:thiamine phosphate synthase n=1 Tax=Fusibacter sp. JL216-2 TaxID=3071453 RepID=UPI003D329DA3
MLTLITNRHICGEDNFKDVVTRAISAGVDQIILREKDLDDKVYGHYAAYFKTQLKESQKLIIHSRISLAERVKADGVHFTFQDFMAVDEETIAALKSGESSLVIGVSVHSLEEALASANKGASYLLASHVFETDCKAGLPGRGLSFIHRISSKVHVPVIGLGGISPENTLSVIDAGASGVAVMSAIMGANDVEASLKSFTIQLNRLT